MRSLFAIGALFTLLQPAFAADKPRVFITDHAVEIASLVSNDGAQAGTVNPEMAKTLSKECPAITVTTNPARANYVVVWENKDSEKTHWGEHENEFTVFNREGDLVSSGATHRKGSAAKDICRALSDTSSASREMSKSDSPSHH